MKITVLGSGSAFSDRQRFNSCYLVETSGGHYLIDAGSDALRAIQKSHVDLFGINEIIITHMHADHCGGLPAVLTGMHVLERKQPIKVRVPHSHTEFTRTWLANLFVYEKRMSFEFEIVPIHAGKFELEQNVEIEFTPTSHLEKYAEYSRSFGITPASFSITMREGSRSFFFSSDIASVDEVSRDLSANSVSLVEATHPSIDEIARLSELSGENVYFTHIPQELEPDGAWTTELRKKHGIDRLRMVHDGQVLEV